MQVSTRVTVARGSVSYPLVKFLPDSVNDVLCVVRTTSRGGSVVLIDWSCEWKSTARDVMYAQPLLRTVTHFTLHYYQIAAWAIRRPWLTFVNALANSILGRFYTARTQDLLRAIGLWCCESWEWVKMRRGKLIPLHKGALCRCGWNRRDVILFCVVRKITASRENRGELLGDAIINHVTS